MKMLSKQEQKDLAIKVMKELGIISEIINDFEQTNQVMCTEAPLYASYYLNETQQQLVNELEARDGCLVFHATINNTEFGELFTCMIISQYEEDNIYTIEDAKQGLVFCYVFNLDDEWNSEYGTCQFKLMPSGDIKRLY